MIPKKLYVKGLANIALYVLLALIALLTIAIAPIKGAHKASKAHRNIQILGLNYATAYNN
ncbi:MAG: hypothetical protein QXX95_01710 [Nitrososphaerales archaeon]